jgi:hypothetical protein
MQPPSPTLHRKTSTNATRGSKAAAQGQQSDVSAESRFEDVLDSRGYDLNRDSAESRERDGLELSNAHVASGGPYRSEEDY